MFSLRFNVSSLVNMFKLFLIIALMASVFVTVSSTDTCMECKDNEEYSECVNGGCDARNCSQLGNSVPCVKISEEDCIGGCICINGYLRDDNGTCIEKEQCPKCGGDPNAMPGCGVFCRQCSNYKSKTPLPCPDFCKINGCECKPNFIYDRNTGKCVKPQQCTPTCKANEVFSNCTNGGCDAKNCSQLGFPVPCIKIDPKNCIQGCVCQPNHLRADNGTCIPKTDCPSCGGDENAKSGCGVFCRQCKGNVICPKICKPNSCDCKPDFVYDPNINKCVKQSDCTPTCTDNEVFSNCTNGGSDARNCSQLGFPVPCIKKDPKACIKGCVCQQDYLRAANGTCIPKTECPSCGGDDNAQSGCGVFCRQCKGNVPCPRICKLNACDCKPDYVYDSNINKCVLRDQCTPTCNVNEEFSSCANGVCRLQNCSQYGQPIPYCPKFDTTKCKPGCICKNNFLRNDNGQCISQEQCKAESSCTKPPSCKKNEVWESCPDCNPQTCSTIGQKMTCPDKPCKGACRCIKGYARDNNGDCVPKEYCSRCTKPNEVYDPCPDCSPQTCETMNKVYNCPLIPSDPCDPRCKPACRCKRGYFRNKIGECISAENCAKCSNLHEYWSCGPVCDNRCDSKYGQDNCNVVNVKCNEMCYCEKGFARAANETCIPKEDCEYECPADEVYSECPAAICAPKKCSDAGYPLNCTTINDGDPCPESPCCICKEGYLRDDNGKCILSTNCPSCRGDRNATSACENHCGNTCADYNKENVICTLSCKLNGCSCRKGYVYDSNTKQCVLPCDCTKQCQANEEYSTCANGVCRAQSCSEYGQPPRFCPVFDKTKCIPGCVCKDKCLKNKNGKCIPQDQCPEAKTEAPPCDT